MATATGAANNGPSTAAADDDINRRIQEVSVVLHNQGQLSLADLVLTITFSVLAGDATNETLVVINDQVRGGVEEGDIALLDEFCHSIHVDVRNLLYAGYDEHEVSRVFPHLVLSAAQRAAGLVPADDDEPYRNGGFGSVAASAAAVRSLKMQTFRATAGGVAEGGGCCGVTECSICFEEFVDGAQVSVMPCPLGGHKFHPDCIAKWLGISNMCPLCRHELPIDE